MSKKRAAALPQKAALAPNSTTELVPNPAYEKVLTRVIHSEFVPGAVYQHALTPILGKEKKSRSSDHARDVIERMVPRDPVEEMLIAQLLFAHARVMRLTDMANQQTGLDAIRVIHDYADRASNTYRRLMLALIEYRRPPRAAGSGDSFTVVKQANIANQQVIQNHEISNKGATNEQGCRCGELRASSNRAGQSSLRADTGGAGVAPGVSAEGQAVEISHRAKDTRRQGAVPRERDKAR